MIAIEALLGRTIGLNPASLGPTGIQRAVRSRMRALGLRRSEDYRQFLLRSRAEWNELVESVLITETWFFRDPESIGIFVRLVLDVWLPSHPSAGLRILSLPCASGEEPCSLVMALLDAGVPPDRFQVDAVDISARALARAQRGLYRKNSFRGRHLGFRQRWFQPTPDGFLLAQAVRDRVRFFHANLLSDTFLPGHAIYDFIFCRNLLIYFDRASQQRALARLQGFLAPSGVLLVGPVEQPVVLDHGFASISLPTAFVPGKAGFPTPRHDPARASTRPDTISMAKSGSRVAPQHPDGAGPSQPPTRKTNTNGSPQADLDTARRFAEAGRLCEAAEICEAHLRHSRTSVQAYYLLGLVHDARGDASAADCYRKALYLEPNHYESLLQMASWLHKNGDPARARTFQTRARRLKPGT